MSKNLIILLGIILLFFLVINPLNKSDKKDDDKFAGGDQLVGDSNDMYNKGEKEEEKEESPKVAHRGLTSRTYTA